MATVTSFNSQRMKAIEDSTVIRGAIEAEDQLILYTRDGTRINAGTIKGGAPEWIQEYTPIVDRHTQELERTEEELTGIHDQMQEVVLPVLEEMDYVFTETLPGMQAQQTQTNANAVAALQAAQAAANKVDDTIKTITRQYCLSSSETTPPEFEDAWVDSPPIRPSGQYVWERLQIVRNNDQVLYTDPIMTTGSQGDRGLKGLDGDKGLKGDDGLSSYTHIAYADDSSGGGFSQNAADKTYMGVYVDHLETDSSDPSKYHWSLIKGADGLRGIQGKTGDDGKTPYLHLAWSDSDDGSVNFNLVDPGTRGYLGTYTDFIEADSTDPTAYKWAKIQGEDGEDGLDGRGITSTTIAYVTSTSGTSTPSSGWGSTIPSVPEGRFLWTRTTIKYTSGSDSVSYTVSKQGQQGDKGLAGDKGDDGKTSYFHVAYATNATGTAGFSTTNASNKTYVGTYTDFIEADSTDPIKYTWQLVKGADGSDGKGVTSSVVTYLNGASGTTPPTGTWLENPPTVAEGQFLWTKTVTTFSDGATTTAYSVAKQGMKGDKGDDGKFPVSITPYYQTANTGTPPVTIPDKPNTLTPNAAWGVSEPTFQRNLGLFRTERILFSDDTFEWTDVVKVQSWDGVNDGLDLTVVGTLVEYASGTAAAATGTWGITPPTGSDYYWMRITTSYGDGSTSQAKPVRVTGPQGPKGDNAKLINISATTQILTSPTAGGATTPATSVVTGTATNTTINLWQYSSNGGTFSGTLPAGVTRSGNVVAITGSTMAANTITVKMGDSSGTEDVFTVAKVKESKGVSGTAITYQSGTSATTAPIGTWVANPPAIAENNFLWTRTITTYTDNSTVTAYSVAKQGGQGTQGAPGVGTSSVAVTYQSSTSGTTTPTGTWSTSIPTVAEGSFLWTRTITTYTNSTTSTTYSVAKQGSSGADAYTVLLSNESHVFPAGPTNAIAGSTTSAVIAYKGATRTAATIGTITGNVTGLSTSITDNGKNNASITISTTTSLTTKNGILTVPITVDGKSFTRTISWSLALQGRSVTSIVEQYYLSTSATSQTGGSWQTTVPTWIDGRYYWTRSVISYSEGDPTTTTAVMVSGGKGGTGAAGKGIVKVDVMYYLSTSPTALAGGTWLTDAPTWIDGRYMWSKTVTSYTTGSPTESPAINLTGAKGSTGNKGDTGVGVESVTPLYTLTPVSESGEDTVPPPPQEQSAVIQSTHHYECKVIGVGSPGLNGFRGSSDRIPLGGIYVQRFIANLPVGYTFYTSSNSVGSEPGAEGRPITTQTWLTSNVGTGKPEEYLRLIVAGTTGSSSSTTHIYVNGPTPTAAEPLIWKLYYSRIMSVANTPNDPNRNDYDFWMGRFYHPNAIDITPNTSPKNDFISAGGSPTREPFITYADDNPGNISYTRKENLGGWSTFEPEYTPYTDLYRTEQVKFHDGSYQYTPVVKSSSYTASTDAIERADEAYHIGNTATAVAEGMITVRPRDWYAPDEPGHQVGRLWVETSFDTKAEYLLPEYTIPTATASGWVITTTGSKTRDTGGILITRPSAVSSASIIETANVVGSGSVRYDPNTTCYARFKLENQGLTDITVSLRILQGTAQKTVQSVTIPAGERLDHVLEYEIGSSAETARLAVVGATPANTKLFIADGTGLFMSQPKYEVEQIVGMWQSDGDSTWMKYALLTSVLIVAGRDGMTIIDGDGMQIGHIEAGSISGEVLMSETVGAEHIIVGSLTKAQVRPGDPLGLAAETASYITIGNDPVTGKTNITIVDTKDGTASINTALKLESDRLAFYTQGKQTAYMTGDSQLYITRAVIEESMLIGKHLVRSINPGGGTNSVLTFDHI